MKYVIIILQGVIPMTKTAIVTGGSRGIGAATSSLLAANGYNVIINYNASADAT